MPDIEDLINRLEGPPPRRTTAPRPPRWSYQATAAIAMAAAVLISAGAWLAQDHYQAARGLEGDYAALDLRMVVEREGQAYRVSRGSTYFLGERVFFRLSASREQQVSLWVVSPGGRELITVAQAAPTAYDLVSAGGLMGYEFDTPGEHSFILVQGDVEACTPRICPSVTVEVR